MGQKITIDSATMVNKGLEVMEAKWLFDVDLDQIEVVVHPQSVIHSMVEYEDGAVIAQLRYPGYEASYSVCIFTIRTEEIYGGTRLDFAKLGQMTFEAPDFDNI